MASPALRTHARKPIAEDDDLHGTSVVIAKRLCDSATAGQILCTNTVSGLLTGRAAFRFKDLGAAELKGIAEPVGVAEVLYEAEDRGPLLRQTPFVGRRAELKRISEALDAAFSDRKSTRLNSSH